MKRREFVASVAAAAHVGASAAAGKPVRETPLRSRSWGPLFYDEAERREVAEVIETRRPFRFGGGPNPPVKTATFEKEFAARMQAKYALAVTSGTAALETAVSALQIGPGDEVILPAWTWHSTFTAIVRAGALPVCAEIDESFNLDPSDIESRITPNTKAIIAVHLQGNPADMDPIMAIARKHRLKVIEDCAQAVGASYKGRPLGSIGDIGAFSHQLSKTITAGEGGSVITNDPVLFERACRFHDVGLFQGPHKAAVTDAKLNPFVGTNFRLNEFSGGVLLAQIRKIDTIIKAVRANAHRVYDGIRDLPGAHLRRLPDPEGELGTGIFLGFQDKEQRDRYMAAMKAENIPAVPPGGSVILPIQPYIENKWTAHPAWPTWTSERGRAIRYGAASCPRTIDILSRFAGVLIDPKFTKADTDDIIAAIRKVYPTIRG
ncbi:MAG: DegT/DnrJ/EryC1/StrS family aminotransferase [Acidobacteriota bacterium]